MTISLPLSPMSGNDCEGQHERCRCSPSRQKQQRSSKTCEKNESCAIRIPHSMGAYSGILECGCHVGDQRTTNRVDRATPTTMDVSSEPTFCSMFSWTSSVGNTTRKLYNEVSAFLLKSTTAANTQHSPLSTMEDLPQELLLKILEYIGDDRTTARNLSLVASTFAGACQKHLFTTVTIRPPIQPSVSAPPRTSVPRAEALSCISAHPTLRAYVQAIAILDEYTGPFKSWLKDPDLGRALRLLSEATTITRFTFSRHVGDPALEYAISEDLMTAVTNLCRSPTLQSISLLNNAPLRLLELCGPSVQCVVLEEEKDFSKPSEPFERLVPLALTSLRLGRRTPLAAVADWFLDESRLIQLGELQRLSVCLARLDESPQLSRLLPPCPAIEELEIQAGPYILPRSTEGELLEHLQLYHMS